MPLIRNYAADDLITHIGNLSSSGKQGYLAIIHGSHMETVRQRMLQTTEAQRLLTKTAQETGCIIYLFQDNDIAFLLTGYGPQPRAILHNVFHALLPHMNPAEIDSSALFSYLDVNTQQEELLAWLRSKYILKSQPLPTSQENEDVVWDLGQFSHAASTRSFRKRPLIGICEDNRAQRQLAKSILAQEFDVTLAADGLEAIQLYATQAPDIVFLDIHMPRMDGLSVLDQIMRHDEHAHIIMFSTHSSETSLKTAMDKGAKGFVCKPFTADALLRYARKAAEEVCQF